MRTRPPQTQYLSFPLVGVVRTRLVSAESNVCLWLPTCQGSKDADAELGMFERVRGRALESRAGKQSHATASRLSTPKPGGLLTVAPTRDPP